jgi:hypothetical protein
LKVRAGIVFELFAGIKGALDVFKKMLLVLMFGGGGGSRTDGCVSYSWVT